jgi:uracil-DNA glycosylase
MGARNMYRSINLGQRVRSGPLLLDSGGSLRSLPPFAMPTDPLAALNARVTACTRCPRLVAWRERVADEKRAAFQDEAYWGLPVPSFGDTEARILVVGLAPAAHGANRTGRMFTGDRSGDWLFGALHRAGLANQPEATSRDDGLELRDVWITAMVRCAPPANKPTPAERERCRPWLDQELDLLGRIRAIVTLGGLAYAQTLRLLADRGAPVPKPRPRFGHGVEVAMEGHPTVLGSYHPSQQNTFTGTLTEPMFDEIWSRARDLADIPPELEHR